MQGTDISWEEKEIIDKQKNEIRFCMVSGDFDVFEGLRGVKKTENGSTVYINLKIDWHSNKQINDKILCRKSNLAIRWMLRSIRERLDADTILKYEHHDKQKETITSELISYKNLKGKTIVGFFDYIESKKDSSKLIIIPSGYGETKRDALTISYYLVSNGFNILRYDNTDHIGESDGDIFNTTLPKMKDDIIATLDYAQNRFGVMHAGIIGSSLSKRVALKAAAEDSRISFILGLVGIVNLKGTLESVYNLDIIGKVESGEEKHVDVAEILGHEVGREFPLSAIKEKYHDLESTRQDIKKLKIPFVFIVGERDEWVSIEDVRMVFGATDYPNKELHVVKDAMHLIYENPKAARSILKQTVISCKKYMVGPLSETYDIIEPGLRQIAAQNRIEKTRLRRLVEITKEDEKIFWKNYLNKYVLITNSKDFRNLLSLIEIHLGLAKEGDFILDAGCGNGHFGAWLLWCAAARYKDNDMHNNIIERNYVGVDFVKEALDEAKIRHKDIQDGILKEINSAGTNKILNFEYYLHDLEKKLPFKTNMFDKICCNLVVSYLQNPFYTIKELIRVLKPNGRIVITSLKPHPDLSSIYRSFIKSSVSEEDAKEARILLGAAGKIKKKEGEGHYKFFSERQLRSLLSRAKAVNIKDHRVFSDQAILLIAEKPNDI